MTEYTIMRVMRRMDAIWPRKTPGTEDERAEWSRFLRTLDDRIGFAAVDELKMTLTFRPSMADFRAAYKLAAALPPDDLPMLPPGKHRDGHPEWSYIYGQSQAHWVYCWRCDMAISLEEQANTALFDMERGFYHQRCPKSGSGPSIPNEKRIERDEYCQKKHILIGRGAS